MGMKAPPRNSNLLRTNVHTDDGTNGKSNGDKDSRLCRAAKSGSCTMSLHFFQRHRLTRGVETVFPPSSTTLSAKPWPTRRVRMSSTSSSRAFPLKGSFRFLIIALTNGPVMALPLHFWMTHAIRYPYPGFASSSLTRRPHRHNPCVYFLC